MEIDDKDYCVLGTHILLNKRYWNAHTADHFSFFFSTDGKCGRTVWFYNQIILIIWKLQINATIPLAPWTSRDTTCGKIIFFSRFSEAFWIPIQLLECAVEIANNTSFVFRHPKNAISQRPLGILQIVRSSGKYLTRKLPSPYLSTSFFNVEITSVADSFLKDCSIFWTNTLPVLRYLFVHFQWHSARKSKLAEPFMKAWA